VLGLRDFEWYEGPPAEERGTGAFLGSWKQISGDIMSEEMAEILAPIDPPALVFSAQKESRVSH
jgi:hypothetical protein